MSFKSVWAATFIFFLWCGGFIWFVYDMPSKPVCPDCTTDAIVVLTGGNNRIATALDLLSQKLSNHLLISGVNPGTSFKSIKDSSGFLGHIPTSQITLDERSRSTNENALYTSKWVRANDYKSIRLVTANYHIRRSLLEFQQLMPDVNIFPHPITTQETMYPLWCKDYRIFCIFLYEYHKYLGALLKWKVKSLLYKRGSL